MFQPEYPEILNEEAEAPCLLVVDHASNRIPEDYGSLGLSEDILSTHVAFDIGIMNLAREIAGRLNIAAVMAPCSRLLVDPNRWIEDAQCILATSDGVGVPANLGLSRAGRMERFERFFWPYHAAIDNMLDRLTKRHRRIVFLSLHSCTRVLGTARRDGHAGTFWHENDALSRIVIEQIGARRGVSVQSNYPYTGANGTFTIDYHTWGTGHLACGLEILNDLLGTTEQVALWADLIGDGLQTAMRGLQAP